jgi:hypothetical protein
MYLVGTLRPCLDGKLTVIAWSSCVVLLYRSCLLAAKVPGPLCGGKYSVIVPWLLLISVCLGCSSSVFEVASSSGGLMGPTCGGCTEWYVWGSV